MGGVVSGIAGYAASENQINAANNARVQALQQWNGVSAPEIAPQELNFAQYQNAGNLTPQDIQTMQMDPSAMAGISTDPRLAQAQMAALQQLSQVGQMGMTPAQAAALQDSQRAAASMAQAKSAQLQDEFARRGMGGSGAELAARLQAAQSGADRASQSNNQVAQNAQQNALQAMSQSGQLAGNIQGQQFGQQADIAKAKDYINQFNTQNSQNVQNMNVQAANAAALRNLQNTQNVSQQNTQLQNQQQQANKQLLQQQFNNQTALAAGRAGQYQGIAQANQANAARTANAYAGAGQGIDTGVGALYNAYNKPSSSSDTLDSDMQYMQKNNYGSSGDQSDANDFAELYGM